MKIVYYSNWIILSLYAIYLIYSLLTINKSGLDAAGRGMSQAYSYIGLIAVVILALLNLINVDWVRVGILMLSLTPVFLSLKHMFRSNSLDKAFNERKHNIPCYDEPHLKDLIYAVDSYNVDEVKNILSANSSNINDLGNCGRTILSIAAYNASVFPTPDKDEIVETLLEKGADPNVFDPPKAPPPLARVAIRSSLRIFESLLKSGADPNARGENDIPILCQLVRERQPTPEINKKVELLVKDYKADPNIPFGFAEWTLNETALIMAATNDMWKVCMLLIDAGADVNYDPPNEYNFDFWQRLNFAQQRYLEKGETPEEFNNLLAYPIVQEHFKK